MRTRTQPPEALRIQLEGALETVERAQRLYGLLARRLSGPGWRWWLRKEPGLLAEARALPSALSEALERVERRALHEPEAASALRGLLGDVRARQTRLERLARSRLKQLSFPGGAALPEALGALEAWAREPAVRLPEDATSVLLHTRQDMGALTCTVSGVALLLLLAGLCFPLKLGLPLALPFACTLLAGKLLPPGRFWLTRDRLVWKPRLGEAVEVPLASLSPRALDFRRKGNGSVDLRVEGSRPLVVPALRLEPAQWVEVLRALPPAGPGEEDARLAGDVALLSITLISRSLRGHTPQGSALLVLRPDGAVSFPEQASPTLRELAEMLTRMQRARAASFDGFLEAARQSYKGVRLRPGEVHATPMDTPQGPGYRFIIEGNTVALGAVDAEQREAVERILQRWHERRSLP